MRFTAARWYLQVVAAGFAMGMIAQAQSPATGAIAGAARNPQPLSSSTAKQARPAQQTADTAIETRGELKFQQNCSRCHNAPQELSPRISGTVVMHMRVRASLSEADANAILRYLAP